MIHHISVSAKNPQHVAEVLAELWGGQALPFPPFPGSHIVIVEDGHGTAIEVSPLGTELVPGADGGEVQGATNDDASPFTATHAAITVPASEERIKQVAAREGWRCETYTRGGAFEVVEFWIENRLLVEMLPPGFERRYLEALTLKNYAAMFGFELEPAVA